MGPGFESQRDHKGRLETGCFLYFRALFFLEMAWVYILHSSKLNKYYVGACTDLGRRLYEHSIGHSKFTAAGVPWALVYREEMLDLPAAKKRELEIKKKKSRLYIESLIQESGL